MNHLFKNPHVTALITVFFWSTTFIATKLLLIDFSPTAILFLRYHRTSGVECVIQI